MKIIKCAITVLLAAVAVMSFADTTPTPATSAAAATPPEAALKQLVEQRLGEGTIEERLQTKFLSCMARV